jgi:hypothetical protein
LDPANSNLNPNARVGAGGTVLIGSSVEASDGTRDLLIGVGASSWQNGPPEAHLTASYAGASFLFPDGSIDVLTTAFVELRADGAGRFSTVIATGQSANQKNPTKRQAIVGAQYKLGLDGAGNATFGESATLLAGSREIFVSSDGEILLGFSPDVSRREILVAVLWDGRHTLAQEIVGKPRFQAATHSMPGWPTARRSTPMPCSPTPIMPHWHSKIVVDSCNAGKDIYSEKPMTHQVSEGFAMIAAAEKNKRIVEIGSGAADTWTSIKARELIVTGAIGDLRTIEVSTGRNTPNGAWESWMPPPGLSPDSLDWNTWLGNAPKIPFDPIRFVRWRGYRAYGTGVAGDLMVHLLTALIHSAGIKGPRYERTPPAVFTSSNKRP